MMRVVFAAPLAPGKREAWIRFTQRLMGPRRAAYEAACRAAGIRHEQYWLVERTEGAIAVIVADMADGDAWCARLDGAERPFTRWLGRQLRELHAYEGKIQPELIAEWDASAGSVQRQEDWRFVSNRQD